MDGLATQKAPMVRAECPKKFVIGCLRGNVFLSFEKIFVSEVYVYCFMSQPATTCSKLTIETVEQGVKYVQS